MNLESNPNSQPHPNSYEPPSTIYIYIAKFYAGFVELDKNNISLSLDESMAAFLISLNCVQDLLSEMV